MKKDSPSRRDERLRERINDRAHAIQYLKNEGSFGYPVVEDVCRADRRLRRRVSGTSTGVPTFRTPQQADRWLEKQAKKQDVEKRAKPGVQHIYTAGAPQRWQVGDIAVDAISGDQWLYHGNGQWESVHNGA